MNQQTPLLLDHRAAELFGLRRSPRKGDDDIAQKDCVAHRETQDIGRLVFAAIDAIELTYPVIVGKEDAQLGLVELENGKHCNGKPLYPAAVLPRRLAADKYLHVGYPLSVSGYL